MTKLLEEITLTAERPLRPDDAIVENMSRVVCSLLIQGLQKRVVTPGFWKISIRVNARDENESGKILLGVLVVNRNFPVSEFIEWPRKKRQDYMLDFVSNTLREILEDRNLDAVSVETAVQHVVDRDFMNAIIDRKRFPSPTGNEVARIECEQEMDEARIYVVLEEKGLPLQRTLVATTSPEEFIFQSFFGDIEWDGSSRMRLRKVDGTSVSVV